ncbi:hypothetical protein [Hymenobacter sedentarius]|uniref:hypothetical protein n=1 Tax=Hymenobacter sedentarius TaxID=1411621 RepID=UPI0012FD1E03|nr:hypothetical protein [Hymenobacter sedentarius]
MRKKAKVRKKLTVELSSSINRYRQTRLPIVVGANVVAKGADGHGRVEELAHAYEPPRDFLRRNECFLTVHANGSTAKATEKNVRKKSLYWMRKTKVLPFLKNNISA